jgi:hypothetical protein
MENSQITKLEHSSTLLEHKGKRILFDPGSFTVISDTLNDIDILVLTHGHEDHFHQTNIAYILEQNPQVLIITNSEVAEMLKDLDANVSIVEGSNTIDIDGIIITAHDQNHEEIYKEFWQVQNTGYYVDNVFFHPGDAFTKPNRDVAVIATIISGPFMQIKSTIDYINDNPSVIHLGVHDAVMSDGVAGWIKNIIESNINPDCRYAHPAMNKIITV